MLEKLTMSQSVLKEYKHKCHASSSHDQRLELYKCPYSETRCSHTPIVCVPCTDMSKDLNDRLRDPAL